MSSIEFIDLIQKVVAKLESQTSDILFTKPLFVRLVPDLVRYLFRPFSVGNDVWEWSEQSESARLIKPEYDNDGDLG